MFYLGVLLRTTAQDTASQKALEQLLERGKGGARKYRGFVETNKQTNKKTLLSNIRRLQLITHTKKKTHQTSQINHFSSLLSMGRHTCLIPLKSSHSYVSQLLKAYILFFSILKLPSVWMQWLTA